jgi:TMEM175 potassium channel family protein
VTASSRSRSRCSCSSSASASDAGEHLLRSILHEWPSLLAYITSFLTIGVVWLQHSAITGALRAADVTLYRLNLLVLLLT